jgi:hypothetical protein
VDFADDQAVGVDMPFLSADVAFATLHGYRLCWLPGAYGNGKTLLAIGMYAQYFRSRGYRLVSNLRSVWTEPDLDAIGMDENGHLKAFILIDEGGQYFTSGRSIKDITRNPRKMDYILAFPSFHDPHRKAQIYQIQPIWSYRSAGIPMINYQWSVKIGHYKNQGSFQWFGFQEMFGTFSSSDPGYSPAKIRKWLDFQNAEFRRIFGRDEEDEILDEAEREEGGDGGSGVSAVLRAIGDVEGELASMASQADEIEALAARGAGRRKRRG